MKKYTIPTFVVLLSVLFLPAPGTSAGESGYKGYPRGNALITVHELKERLDSRAPNLVLLAAEGDREYVLGHIPGAVQVDRPEYAAPPDTQNGVAGNILGTAEFTRFAQRLGINKDSDVIIYDDRFDATRLWWAFTYYGKSRVRVLDGGIRSWKEAGYGVDYLPPKAPARSGNFIAAIALPHLRVDTADIVATHRDTRRQLWDNRSDKEYTGEERKNGAARAGRIPGSRHAEWTLFKKKENPAEWVTAAEMEPVLQKLGFDRNKEQYFYCQSGVRSTQALFALYLSGWPVEKLHNYDSSWIGWSKDPDLPLQSGLPAGDTTEHARK